MNVEDRIFAVCILFVGFALSIYGYTYLFVPKHYATPVALPFGVILIIIGALATLAAFTEKEIDNDANCVVSAPREKNNE